MEKRKKVGNKAMHQGLRMHRNETFKDRKKESRKKACRGKVKGE